MVCIETIFKFIFYLHLIHVCGLSGVKDAISVKTHVEHDRFQLDCIVPKLTDHIDFKYPNKKFGYAHCIVPTPLTEINNPDCHCNCTATPTCKCKITQNIDTGTTSLVLNDEVGLSKMFGTYTCLHGLDSISFQVNDTAKLNYDEEKSGLVYIIMSTGWILFFVLGLYNMHSIGVIRKCYLYLKVPGDDVELQSSSGMEQFCENPSCQQSENNVAQKLCIECKTAFCVNCSSIHKKDHQKHNMCQMQYITCLLSSNRINCVKCFTIKAEQFCKICKISCCESCSNDHYHEGSRRHLIAIIYLEPSWANRKKTTQRITHSYSVSINTKDEISDRLTICGLSFISDGRLVVVDMCYKELLVFRQTQKQLSKKLNDEPRAMTVVRDNIIAITFGCKMLIKIYEIFETVNILITVDLSKINIKPFSIAYDEGFLVLEAGEGNRGQIIMVKENVILGKIENNCKLDFYDEYSSPAEVGGDKCKCILLKQASIYAYIPHTLNFAFFTGNTMRIALEVKKPDASEGCIYVSALGKKMICCIDFQGICLWHELIPSPRGIYFVKQSFSLNKHLIVASKLNNTVYGLNKDDGSTEVLLEGGQIKSPRFISYNYEKRWLCSQEEENKFSMFVIEPP